LRTLATRLRRFGLAVGVLALAVGYSQWIALPWLPPWVMLGLAALGAGLVAWSAATAFARAVRRYQEHRAVPVGALAVNAAALVVLVVLPAARLVGALGPTRSSGPRVLSSFGDWLGAEGYPRLNGRHRGVDLAGQVGSPVLAAAGGTVIAARDNRDSCGLLVVIEHAFETYRTIYCHLAAIRVRPGDTVARGDEIGAIGTSGMRAWPGYEHVHWELQRGRYGPYEDPLARTVGCVAAGARYPADRLVLTYPVRC
jgi:murein DD-endopeptidase MepM/ murein hydrolase activator NlpD